jgi:hypothetical protein
MRQERLTKGIAMVRRSTLSILAFLLTAVSALAQQKTVTIAFANSPNMIRLKELANLGTQIGQNMAGALSGHMSVDQALKLSQSAAQRAIQQGGYSK